MLKLLQEKLKLAGRVIASPGKPRAWIIGSALVLLTGGLLLTLTPGLETPWSKGNSHWKKNTVVVERGTIEAHISATGVIRPFNQVKISPKQTGLLKKLLVQQGDHVKAGDLLAYMDDSNLLGQVQATHAAYLAAKNNYLKQLHGNRPQEVADAAAQVTKAVNQVRQSERAVARAQAQLEAIKAQVVRDETNAIRLTQLAAQGAISDQERLNAVTQSSVSKAQLHQFQSELRQSESMLAQSHADLESIQQRHSLVKAGYRQEDIESAHASMVQAEGTWKFLQSQLNDTQIRAPFDGIISQKYTDEGAIVTPTSSAATTSATSSSIVSLAGKLELVAAVSETDIHSIKVGQAVEITANAYPNQVFHGHVVRIAPEAIVTQNVTTFEVHATIDDDPQYRLLSGMNVNAEFMSTPKGGVLLIPTACVISKQGKTGVLVPDKDHNPEFKVIKIGPTSATKTVVESGLHQGDRVFLGLTKAQLEDQGYADASRQKSNRPEIPRGFGR